MSDVLSTVFNFPAVELPPGTVEGAGVVQPGVNSVRRTHRFHMAVDENRVGRAAVPGIGLRLGAVRFGMRPVMAADGGFGYIDGGIGQVQDTRGVLDPPRILTGIDQLAVDSVTDVAVVEKFDPVIIGRKEFIGKSKNRY